MTTYNTEQEARIEGEMLLDMMHGEGWSLCVWEDVENLGWNFYVENDGLFIYLNNKWNGKWNERCYYIRHSNRHFNNPKYPKFTDPNEAVRYQIQFARDIINNLNNIVFTLENKFS